MGETKSPEDVRCDGLIANWLLQAKAQGAQSDVLCGWRGGQRQPGCDRGVADPITGNALLMRGRGMPAGAPTRRPRSAVVTSSPLAEVGAAELPVAQPTSSPAATPAIAPASVLVAEHLHRGG